MKVAFVGSRDYPAPPFVQRMVQGLALKYPDAVVVSGGARGVDMAAENAAITAGLEVVSFQPCELPDDTFAVVRVEGGSRRILDDETFPSYGQAAFFRNGLIVEEVDKVMAFWDLRSQGTWDTIQKAAAAKKPLYVYDTAGRLLAEKKD